MKTIFVITGFLFLSVNAISFQRDIKYFMEVIKEPNLIKSNSTNDIEIAIDRYLKRLCKNPDIECPFKRADLLLFKDNKLKNLLHLLKKIVKQYHLPHNRKIMKLMNKYRSNICKKNFNVKECIIRKSLFNKQCIFHLTCVYADKKHNIIKNKIKFYTSIFRIGELDYRNNILRYKEEYDDICFKPSECVKDGLHVPNHCDNKYYYVCDLKNNSSKLYQCYNSYFDGKDCHTNFENLMLRN